MCCPAALATPTSDLKPFPTDDTERLSLRCIQHGSAAGHDDPDGQSFVDDPPAIDFFSTSGWPG